MEIPAEMGLADETGFPHKGYMDFVDNRVDPNTGTMRARGVFPNADHSLSPGFFARLRIPGSGKYPALLIPDRALGSDQAQKFVYVVNAETKVEFRPVKAGPMIDGFEHRNRSWLLAVGFMSSVFLSGCAVGPNYKPPQTTVAGTFWRVAWSAGL